MYLSILTSEEKRMFLGLAYDLATSDGDYVQRSRLLFRDTVMKCKWNLIKKQW